MASQFFYRKSCFILVNLIFYSQIIFTEEHEKKVLFPPWVEIFTGGETKCARGSEYSFFYAPGSTNKIVIDFMVEEHAGIPRLVIIQVLLQIL